MAEVNLVPKEAVADKNYQVLSINGEMEKDTNSDTCPDRYTISFRRTHPPHQRSHVIQ